MTRNLIFLFFVTTTNLFAQVSDDFTDGDFINNPTWSGDDSEFRIDESSQLRLNNTSPATNNESYLSVSSEAIYQAEWQFNVGFDGLSGTGLSGSNRMFIYLVSDRENLEDNPQGYYVLIGNSNDEISLYSSLGILIDGVDGTTENGNANITVRVTRDANGNWELLRDLSGGNSFTSEGTANNTDFVTSAFFGVLCDYSSTRSDKFFFDSFSVIGAPIPDTDPPTIQAVNAISDTQVDVTFNENVDEITAGSTGNYVMDGGVSIVGAVRDEMDHTVVHLTTDVLTNGGTYTLTVNNVEDESSNMVATNSQSVFEYLVFGEAVQFDVVINEFMADPNPVIGLPDAEFVELYNRSSKILNLENWVLDGQPIGSFRLDPDSYVIICEDDDLALFSAYTDVLAITTLSLNNSSADEIILTDDSATKIHSISFSGSTEGTSWELINPNGPDYSLNNYGLSTNPDGGTPGEQNSIFDDTPDTIAPTIASISVVSSSALDLTFDEPVEEITAETTDNYLIDGGITIGSAVRDDTDNSLVHLTVPALVSGEIRTLTVNGVTDLSSNAISANSTIDFEYIETEEAAIGDVVINEFYAIPDEESNLPNTEYIELLNISNKFIDLQNWTVSDAGGSSGALPSFILRPDSLVILIPPGETTSFEMFGDVIEVPSMKSLNNSGDDILISNENAVDIYQITYTSATPGISTELINPYGPDYSLNNYGLSTSPDGGTPGEQNSIFDDTPDTIAPTIASISVVSSSALDLTFNESVEEITAETTDNYLIDGGITIGSAVRDDTDNSLVHLTVPALVSGEIRTLTVNGVTDLSSNAISANSTIDFEYIETEEAAIGDVVINEFYAIPDEESNLPNTEYIELLNISNKFLDLQNWTVSDAGGSSGDLPSFILRPDSLVILIPPGETTSFEMFGDVVEVPSMKSLNNSGDDILISNENAVDIYQITYTSATPGISTELINPYGPDYSLNNYGLSTSPDGGTPGEQNSIFDDTPDTIAPTIASISVVSSSALDLTFNEPIEKTTAETAGNYSIDGGITVSTAMRNEADNSLVHLTVSELISTEERTLSISNVQDLSGNTVQPNANIDFVYIATVSANFRDVVINEFLSNPLDVTNDFVELFNRSDKFLNLSDWKLRDESSVSTGFGSFILSPGGYVIIHDEDAAIDYSVLGNSIAIPALTLNNTDDQIEILDDTDTRIDFLIYTDQLEEGISLELINPEDPCITEFSYSASTDISGHTAGAQNSIFDASPDTEAPSITSYGFDGALTIRFSEIMDANSLINGNYTIFGLSISGITVSEFPNSVTLNFLEQLNFGVIYQMTISAVMDCWGNELEETIISFGLGRSPGFNEVLITEIQFDPDPSVVLPDVEFLEIYNNTNNLINLEGLTLSDVSSQVELPMITMNPMEYYVLTTTSAAAEFTGVNAIGVSGFPSLSNSGEQLILSSGDELIFSINYNPAWHDEDKRSGGYTLEMKDLSSPCVEAFNWGSSRSSTGGTPGFKNSNTEGVPDNFGPEIVKVIAISHDSVRVDFNEKIDPVSKQLVSVTFKPDLNTAFFHFDNKLPATLFIILGEDLVESDAHKILIEGVVDCKGNEIQEHEISFAFPSPAEEGDILLSEVLFNPRTNGVDFVELLNVSEKYVSFMNWRLARITEEGIIDEKITSKNELILPPGEFLVFTTDPAVLLSNYPQGNSDRFFEMASLPTYANDTGNVVLLNDLGAVMEIFHYEDDYHYALLESTDGVSLERISYDVDVNDADNWRSASSTQGFATPGYANSQSLMITSPSGNVQAEPKVFIPGNSGSGRDFTTINYQFDQPGKFANVTIFDQTGRLVKNVAEGALLSTSGFMRWDGTTNRGNMARLGYYVILFEVYDSNGNTDTLKETVVVGRDF